MLGSVERRALALFFIEHGFLRLRLGFFWGGGIVCSLIHIVHFQVASFLGGVFFFKARITPR